jgi:hypothetical protein
MRPRRPGMLMRAFVVTLAVAFATAGSATADRQMSIIQKAATEQARSEQRGVTCTPSGPSLTCAFYDPSESGTMKVDGKSLESEGHVWFRAVNARACQFDVLTEPYSDSDYQLEGKVDVCQPGWQLEVWPVGRR